MQWNQNVMFSINIDKWYVEHIKVTTIFPSKNLTHRLYYKCEAAYEGPF